MSHFSLLVISDQKITEASLKKTLQPWHEYGCDGIEDEYVIDVDVTDKIIEEFNKPQKVVVHNRNVFSRWDDRFYTKKPDPKEMWDRNEFELPEGAEEKAMSAEEARTYGIGYKTMLECAEEYYGQATQVGDRFFHKKNPNSKWDWWQVGGRWTGLLKPNYDPNKDPANKETCFLCRGTGTRYDAIAVAAGVTECNGCRGTGIATKWPTEWESVDDIAQIKSIPFIFLRDIAERKALKIYDRAQAVVNGRKIPNWDKMLEANFRNHEKTRDDYWSDPVVKDLQEEFQPDGYWIDTDFLEGLEKSRAEKAIAARRSAVQTFAVVKDGQWYQRGEMGWFGCVSDEKDPEVWSREFEDLLNSLPGDTWVAIVDCHT